MFEAIGRKIISDDMDFKKKCKEEGMKPKKRPTYQYQEEFSLVQEPSAHLKEAI